MERVLKAILEPTQSSHRIITHTHIIVYLNYMYVSKNRSLMGEASKYSTTQFSIRQMTVIIRILCISSEREPNWHKTRWSKNHSERNDLWTQLSNDRWSKTRSSRVTHFKARKHSITFDQNGSIEPKRTSGKTSGGTSQTRSWRKDQPTFGSNTSTTEETLRRATNAEFPKRAPSEDRFGRWTTFRIREFRGPRKHAQGVNSYLYIYMCVFVVGPSLERAHLGHPSPSDRGMQSRWFQQQGPRRQGPPSGDPSPVKHRLEAAERRLTAKISSFSHLMTRRSKLAAA